MRITETENRISLVGLLERKEGIDLYSFLEKWLPDVLGADNFPGPLLIERGHRISKVNKAETQSVVQPRVVMMKFLYYADKTRVMKATRMKGPVLLDNQRLVFFPNVSAELLKQRKIWLSSLSLETARKRHIFDMTSAAEKFVQELQPWVNETT